MEGCYSKTFKLVILGTLIIQYMWACETGFIFADLGFNFEWVNSWESVSCACIPPILLTIPTRTLHIFTGCMLGDGSIRRGPNTKNLYPGPGRYAMTIAAAVYDYHKWLFDTVFTTFCSIGRILTPWPNPNTGKPIAHHAFSTLSSPVFTALHNIWYQYDVDLGTYVKIVPNFVGLMFSGISLAHWIIQDGYFDNYGRAQTIILCTESFTMAECHILQNVLAEWNIISTLKIRNKNKNTYRIRISKKSIPRVRELVMPHMHSHYLYKLGL